MLEGFPVPMPVRPDEVALLHDDSACSPFNFDGCSGSIDSCVRSLNTYMKGSATAPGYFDAVDPKGQYGVNGSAHRPCGHTVNCKSVIRSDYKPASFDHDSQNGNSCTVTTADESIDDPFAELRSATQRNTYSYGDFEVFNIGSPPSGRSAVSCPHCNYYVQTDGSGLDPCVIKHAKHRCSLSRHFKTATHCVKAFARKPLDVVCKLKRYCKKKLA